MTKLKPCPFCGSEATLNHHDTNCDYVHHLFYPIVACNNCGCQTTEDFNRVDDKLAIEEWNTRQSVINWQPIEELTEEEFNKLHSILLTLDDKSIYFGQRFIDDNGEHFIYLDLDVDESVRFPNFEDTKERYTHFAEITPPEVK